MGTRRSDLEEYIDEDVLDRIDIPDDCLDIEFPSDRGDSFLEKLAKTLKLRKEILGAYKQKGKGAETL